MGSNRISAGRGGRPVVGGVGSLAWGGGGATWSQTMPGCVCPKSEVRWSFSASRE